MKQKIRITGSGIFGAAGEIATGSEYVVTGKLPDGWAGKYEVIGRTDEAALTPATPPAEPQVNPDGAKAPAEPAPPADASEQVEGVKQSDPSPLDGIDGMDKVDLIERLEGLGWSGDKRLGAEKLREELIALVGEAK